MSGQLDLVQVRPLPEPEPEQHEPDLTTCRNEASRRASMRLTLRGMAGHPTGLGLAGAMLKEHGDMARVALRRGGRLFNRREALADSHLARAGVPEGLQVDWVDE